MRGNGCPQGRLEKGVDALLCSAWEDVAANRSRQLHVLSRLHAPPPACFACNALVGRDGGESLQATSPTAACMGGR